MGASESRRFRGGDEALHGHDGVHHRIEKSVHAVAGEGIAPHLGDPPHAADFGAEGDELRAILHVAIAGTQLGEAQKSFALFGHDDRCRSDLDGDDWTQASNVSSSGTGRSASA